MPLQCLHAALQPTGVGCLTVPAGHVGQAQVRPALQRCCLPPHIASGCSCDAVTATSSLPAVAVPAASSIPQLVLLPPAARTHSSGDVQHQEQHHHHTQQQQHQWQQLPTGRHAGRQQGDVGSHLVDGRQQQRLLMTVPHQRQQRHGHHETTVHDRSAGSSSVASRHSADAGTGVAGGVATTNTAHEHNGSTGPVEGGAATNSSSSLLQHSGASSSSSVPLERFISRCIKACDSWQQVDVVVREYGPAFNIIHASAAITHLAQLQLKPAPAAHTQQPQQGTRDSQTNEQQVTGLHLVTQQMAQQHHLLQQQFPVLDQQPLLGAQGSSSHSTAATHAHRQQQQQQLVSRLLAQALPLLQQAGARQAANMLWALSVLQHPVADGSAAGDWGVLLLARAAELFPAAEPQHLSNIALAAARLQLPVSQAWLQQLTGAWLRLVRHQQQLSSSNSSSSGTHQRHGQANIVDMHSGSGLRAGSVVEGRVTSREQSGTATRKVSTGQFTGCNNSSRSSSLALHSGSGSQHSQVSVDPAGAAEQAASTRGFTGADISSQATCNLLWAMVQLQAEPQQVWLQEVVDWAAPQLTAWPARSVALFMWAIARLGFQLEPGLVCNSVSHHQHHYNHHQQQQQQQQQLGMQAATGADVCGVHGQPGIQCLDQQEPDLASCILTALRQHAQSFSSRDLAQALWAASVLGLQLEQDLMQQLLTAGSSDLTVGQATPGGPVSTSGWQQHPQDSRQGTQLVGRAQNSTSGNGEPQHVLQLSPQQQQQGRQHSAQPSGQFAHSASLLLWAVSHLCRSKQLPVPSMCVALQPWLVGLMAAAAAAPGQSLGVAAWAVARLGLGSSCPQLVLRLVQVAAQRQRAVTTANKPAARSSSSSLAASDRATDLPADAAPALLWASAKCVLQAQKSHGGVGGQQHQQQEKRAQLQKGLQGSMPTLHRAGLRMAAGAAPAASSKQAVGADRPKHMTGVHAALKAAAAMLALQCAAQPPLEQPHEQPAGQRSLWQLALILWSSSAMQLRLPSEWWQDQVTQLQHILHQQTFQPALDTPPQATLLSQQPHPQQQQQQQQQSDLAQALSVCVWALGKAKVHVPRSIVAQLQQASLPLLQQQRAQALTEQGCVLLLLGFTRLATTAAARLPAQTRLQWPQRHMGPHQLRQQLRQQIRPNRQRQLQQQAWQHEQEAQGASGDQCQQQQQPGLAPQHHMQLSSHQHRRGQRQQQPRLLRAARRHRWWQGYLQQQWAQRVMQQRMLQRQRHGWVAAAGLDTPWLHAYCMYTQQLLPEMSCESLVGVLWALGRLRFHPGASFMAAAQQRVSRLLPSMPPRHIALLLWALARLQHTPEAGVFAALNDAWEMQLAFATVIDTQQVGWAHRQFSKLQELPCGPPCQ